MWRMVSPRWSRRSPGGLGSSLTTLNLHRCAPGTNAGAPGFCLSPARYYQHYLILVEQ